MGRIDYISLHDTEQDMSWYDTWSLIDCLILKSDVVNMVNVVNWLLDKNVHVDLTAELNKTCRKKVMFLDLHDSPHKFWTSCKQNVHTYISWKNIIS